MTPDEYDAELRKERQRVRLRAKERRRERRINGHDGKDCLTREEAIRTIHDIGQKFDTWMAAWPCEFCNYEWWHVGEATRRTLTQLGKRKPNTNPRTEIGNITQSVGNMFPELTKLFGSDDGTS